MGEVMTYRKLEERSRAFAAYLQEGLGLQKGDRVALMIPNLLQYPVALFGILRAGMIVVNVNPLYTPRELEASSSDDSGAAAIVIVSNFAHTLEKVVAKTQVQHVILTRMGDQLSTAKGTLVNFVVKYIKRLVPKYHLPDAISFRSALRTAIACSTSNAGDRCGKIWRFCSTGAPPAWPKVRCSPTAICWLTSSRSMPPTARCCIAAKSSW